MRRTQARDKLVAKDNCHDATGTEVLLRDDLTERWADLLVDYCLRVEPGETILIGSEWEARPLVEACYRAVVRRGAHPLIRLEFPHLTEFFLRAASELAIRRDRLCDGLLDAGFEVFRPMATYFAMTDVRVFGDDDGVGFCRRLPERCGVVAVPASAFYDDPATGRWLVRFAFCKSLETIDDAVERLAGLRTG